MIGGSGNGEAIAANKVRGVRCALAFSDDTARLGREHNDANVLSLGARMYDAAAAIRFAEIFVATPFSAAERHERRLALLAGYEASGELPPRRETSPRMAGRTPTISRRCLEIGVGRPRDITCAHRGNCPDL